MKHTISPDRKTLTITADNQEREALRNWEENNPCTRIQSDAALADFFEPLIANSELDWISAADTGDMTDAPMLAIMSVEAETRTQLEGATAVQVGAWGNPVAVPMFNRILERWAFMDYAVRSPLEDLRDKGECVFVGGPLEAKTDRKKPVMSSPRRHSQGN